MNETERALELLSKPREWSKRDTKELIVLMPTIRTFSDELKAMAGLRASVEAIIASRKLGFAANWLALAAVLLAAVSAVQAYANRQPSEAWQYTIIAPSDTQFRSEMDTMGAQGWELVSARRATGEAAGAAYEMILKKRGIAPTTFPVK